MTETTAIGIPSVHVALNRVKSEIGAVGKDSRNVSQNFNFRGIDAVVNAAAPALNKHGVIVTPEVISHTYETVEVGKNRTPMAHVMLMVCYRFWGPAGDCVESTVFSESMDSGDKAAAKAMSVAYRIALLQTLNLPTDEPDPDSESYERSSANTPNTVNTRIRQNRENRPNRENEPEKSWSDKVAGADSVEMLREVWKAAGAAGALQEKTTAAGGGVITIQDLFYRRHDELLLAKSPDGPPPAAS